MTDFSTAGAAIRPGRLVLPHVEGLRALAALTVYVNHAYAQTWAEARGEQATGLLSVFRLSMVWGHLSVSVFIVISGFCLSLPVIAAGDQLRGGFREFMQRRARRILPPYYGALLLCLIAIYTIIGKPTGTLWDFPIVVDWKAVLAHVLLLQDFFRTSRINYVFWSIAVEWQIYFLFPLLVYCVRRFGVLRTALWALVLGYAIRFAFDETRVARANPHYLGLFALGMLAAYVTRHPAFERWRRGPRWAWLAAAGFLTSLALSIVWDVKVAEQRFHFIDLSAGLMAIGLLIHASAAPERRVARVLGFRPLVFIGTFSYSVYLIHAPLLQIMWQYVLRPLSLSQPAMLFALLTLGAAAMLACAYGFFVVCEEPFMRSPARTMRPATAGYSG
jgi:peptidoglycan/LPS O-acetylase OafA/YrhL